MGNLLKLAIIAPLINQWLTWLLEQEAKKLKPKRIYGNRNRNRGYALEEVKHLSEKDFKKMFRMKRLSFRKLLNFITPHMPTEGNQKFAELSSGSPITNETKLYCALRWLAGGSYLDIIFAFGVSKTAFFTDGDRGILWPTLFAIDAYFFIGLPLSNVEALQRISYEFENCCNGVLKNCVLAIDGWVCRTRKPFDTEVNCVNAYRNRYLNFKLKF